MSEVLLSEVIKRFVSRMPSRLARHPSSCCSRARSWFSAMTHSHALLNPGSLPIWLHDQWEWGPSKWPMYWCEILENEKLDCGVLAELAEVALRETRRKTVRMQLIEEHDWDASRNWQQLWEDAGCYGDWVVGRFAYHEAVGILSDGSLEAWDPTDNCFSVPSPDRRPGRVAAVRLLPASVAVPAEGVNWHGLWLGPNGWQIIDQKHPKDIAEESDSVRFLEG